jgi:hypothetical protein
MHIKYFFNNFNLHSCRSSSIIVAVRKINPFRSEARVKTKRDLELSPKLFGHEAIKDEINGGVYEGNYIPNFSPWVVLAPQELRAVPTCKKINKFLIFQIIFKLIYFFTSKEMHNSLWEFSKKEKEQDCNQHLRSSIRPFASPCIRLPAEGGETHKRFSEASSPS